MFDRKKTWALLIPLIIEQMLNSLMGTADSMIVTSVGSAAISAVSLVDSLNTEKLVLSCRDTAAPYEKGKTFEVTLDGFMVSDNVEVVSCEVIDAGFAVSDHNPVRMDFKLM